MTKRLEALRMPERIHRDWNGAAMRTCEHCESWRMTTTHTDGSAMCADCCDAYYTDQLIEVLTAALGRITELESAITDHTNSTHFCAVCGHDEPCNTDDVCSVLTTPRLWKLIPETPPDDILPKGRYVYNAMRRAAFIDGWKAARIAAGQGEDK